MSIKVEKLPNLGITNFKVRQAEPRRVPEGMPALHFLGLVVGSRGSGKTNAVLNLCKLYNQTGTFDKIYLFSPTFHNDPKYGYFMSLAKRVRVFTEYTNEIFKSVVEEIKADIDEYKRYEAAKKAYELFLRWERPIAEFPPDLLLELSMNDFQPPQSEWDAMPTSLIIFDDLVGNKELYTSNPKGVMPSFAILHRHLLTSMLFLSQVYKGGLPRQLRNNLSLLMLFSNKSPEMMKEVSLEMASHIKPEQFVELWERATQQRHDFLMVDFDTKKDKYRFRQNFDTLLLSAGT